MMLHQRTRSTSKSGHVNGSAGSPDRLSADVSVRDGQTWLLGLLGVLIILCVVIWTWVLTAPTEPFPPTFSTAHSGPVLPPPSTLPTTNTTTAPMPTCVGHGPYSLPCAFTMGGAIVYNGATIVEPPGSLYCPLSSLPVPLVPWMIMAPGSWENTPTAVQANDCGVVVRRPD